MLTINLKIQFDSHILIFIIPITILIELFD